MGLLESIGKSCLVKLTNETALAKVHLTVNLRLQHLSQPQRLVPWL